MILVCYLDRVRNRLEHGRHHVRIERFREVFHEVGERNAVNELHDDVGHIALDLEVVDRSDVGVVQKRCRARLLQGQGSNFAGAKSESSMMLTDFIVGIRVLQLAKPCVDLLDRKRARCCIFERQALDGHLTIEARIPRHYDRGRQIRHEPLHRLVDIDRGSALTPRTPAHTA